MIFEKLFKLQAAGTTVKTEILAGVTTFMTMAYILAVNPSILGMTGMDKSALFTATALGAVIGTLLMSLLANLPFALAPGMGLNAFFTFTVVLGMGHTWQFALTAVFLEGLLFILLTLTNIREMIINSIPMTLKHAVAAGIGLFIAFIGLQNAGIVVKNDAVLVGLGSLSEPKAIVTLIGIVITGILLVRNVKGALLIGIFGAALIGIPFGVTQIPTDSLMSLPPSLEPIFLKFEWGQIFSFDMLVVVFTFLFVDLFDGVGTLVGVCSKANMLTPEGKIPNVKMALLADAVGTTVGAALGTSTVTSYVESASGVAEGGRTGMTSLTVAVLFLLSLFFAPLFLMIPAAATAPILFIVGLFMMSPILKIDLNDFTEALPAFFTIIMMPLTYSIAEGIVFGMISFVIFKFFAGKTKEITWMMLLLAILFVLKHVIG
ncbi:MAG: NCS2 family permease [Sphingobacteriia bacterium]|nr:NCS2 family permease [Sphingobacteriia bacterium]